MGIQRVQSEKCENINIETDITDRDGTESDTYDCRLGAKVQPYSPTGQCSLTLTCWLCLCSIVAAHVF